MRAGFILGEIASGLRRNLSMVVSVILVTLVSLTFVGAALMAQAQVSNLKGFWYDKIQVSIFLCNKNSTASTCDAGPITDAQQQEIRGMIESAPISQYVKSVQFETQEQALTNIREQMQDSPFADALTADQLPASFRISLNDPQQFPIFKEAFSSVRGVDQVVDLRRVLEPLFTVINWGTWIATGVAVLMIIAAALLVATTIRLSAFSRRRETGIMRLVGASKTVVQLPFILEGVIAAVIGALLSILILWLVLIFGITGYLAPMNPTTPFITAGQVWWVAPILIGISVLVAGFSSWITLRKYLKV
ncbi:permease-like cell division protein FtsX [Acaricomes phytoseiuli]|uniref:permease-like cell division protein FtsX n=1 Tax=Acaricomes phytoseiuli TaxID=291968 RepID=UPI0003731742|nr:permease-like cell division protein FtsX [Acaricomes phytoseiuli]MCW1249397.1 permease-like cell division protein FtsX [Acaricomes phytoseiuli]